MDVFTTELFGTLLNFEASRCLSIYMPTHRYGREVQQGPVRLKNLLREAERRLEANAVKAAEAAELLAPVRQLLYDEAFWTQQSDGLALFLAPGSWRRYRLPVGFEEKVVYGERIQVKPLNPQLMTGRSFI
ncbi:MAG: hypothetical protein JSV80_00230 [Acidobacteriota bacterium]|nr:MAG: hypothetical protein JSV80_00230 [Acidobacteriota bacterium]